MCFFLLEGALIQVLALEDCDVGCSGIAAFHLYIQVLAVAMDAAICQ
jgi:hypothetical protein